MALGQFNSTLTLFEKGAETVQESLKSNANLSHDGPDEEHLLIDG